jgi:hypothetical protein
MPDALRARLLGAWRLLDAVAVPLDGSPGRPHGDHSVGLILYTLDGHVAVQIMERDRVVPASADWTALSPDEYAAQGRTYFAYAGRFEVDEAAATVTHHIDVSLFVPWVGGAQPRAVRFDGERLVLESVSPVPTGGMLATMRLTWERATAGADEPAGRPSP